jgi:hypothetical protein
MIQIASAQDEVNTLTATITSLLGPCTSSGDVDEAVNLVRKSKSLQNSVKKFEQSTNEVLTTLQNATVQLKVGYHFDEQLSVVMSSFGISTNNQVSVCVTSSLALSVRRF